MPILKSAEQRHLRALINAPVTEGRIQRAERIARKLDDRAIVRSAELAISTLQIRRTASFAISAVERGHDMHGVIAQFVVRDKRASDYDSLDLHQSRLGFLLRSRSSKKAISTASMLRLDAVNDILNAHRASAGAAQNGNRRGHVHILNGSSGAEIDL